MNRPPARRPRWARIAVALSVTAVTVAACGGDDDVAPTTTLAPVVVETTSPRTTTTTRATTTTTTDATTTTVEAAVEPVMPLTGEPITDELAAARPAMVVKIDNHPQARPQYGLNGADIVFEENVENLTRFAAVYQSEVVDRVGPVRSGRTQDVALLGSLSDPLFVWSGGNPTVTRVIADSDLVDLSPTATRNVGFFREQRPDRRVDSEHTLYARPVELYATFTPLYHPAPMQQFVYRSADDEPAGSPSDGVDVAMDGGVDVGWRWDDDGDVYLRTQDGEPHELADGGQVDAANVVVLEVVYQPSAADRRSPEAQTVGTGVAWVFTGGNMVEGTWERADAEAPFLLIGEDGTEIELSPGRTWVELARAGRTTPI